MILFGEGKLNQTVTIKVAARRSASEAAHTIIFRPSVIIRLPAFTLLRKMHTKHSNVLG